jgi:glutathione S-transferase
MIMKLYYAPGACSLSPHIALREAGLPFDLVKVSFPAKTTPAGEDFTAINPKGAVPALKLDDGELLTESAAIVQYLADKAPTRNLAPAAGTKERYRLVEWLNYVATELHKGFAPLWKPDTPAEYKETVKKNLANQFAFLDKELAGRKFLMGDTFTVADGYLFTILNWANYHKIDLAPYANVAAFIARIGARPAVQEALKAEGLLKAA